MADILTSVKTLLTNEWDDLNTNSRTPTIDLVFNFKRADMGFQDKDLVLLYEESDIPRDSGAGGSNKRRVNVIVADVRTMKTRAQAVAIWGEIQRIIVANEVSPFTGWDIADLTDITDLSDRSTNLWRFTLKLRFESFIEVFT